MITNRRYDKVVPKEYRYMYSEYKKVSGIYDRLTEKLSDKSIEILKNNGIDINKICVEWSLIYILAKQRKLPKDAFIALWDNEIIKNDKGIDGLLNVMGNPSRKLANRNTRLSEDLGLSDLNILFEPELDTLYYAYKAIMDVFKHNDSIMQRVLTELHFAAGDEFNLYNVYGPIFTTTFIHSVIYLHCEYSLVRNPAVKDNVFSTFFDKMNKSGEDSDLFNCFIYLASNGLEGYESASEAFENDTIKETVLNIFKYLHNIYDYSEGFSAGYLLNMDFFIEQGAKLSHTDQDYVDMQIEKYKKMIEVEDADEKTIEFLKNCIYAEFGVWSCFGVYGIHSMCCLIIKAYNFDNVPWKITNTQYTNIKLEYGSMIDTFLNGTLINVLFIHAFVIGKLRNEYKTANNEVNRFETRLNKKCEALSEVKQALKEAKQNITQLTRRNTELSRIETKHNEMIESGISSNQVGEFQEKIDKLTRELSECNRASKEYRHNLSKKQKDIEYWQSRAKEFEDCAKKLESDNSKLRDDNSKLLEDRVFNSIPIDCFIKSMISKNIVIVGGDMMIPQIKSAGLTNCRFYSAGCKSITYNDLSDADLVVVFSTYIDHSTSDAVMNIVRDHKIKILRFNSKSVYILIYRMFNAIFQ